MPKILIIDDDPQVRSLLTERFQKAGFEAFHAENGRQGMKMLSTCLPDLIVTDLIMPEQEGIETIMQLRRDYPQIKIIAISGGIRGGTVNFLAAARELGASKVYKKPFQFQELLDGVNELLGLAPSADPGTGKPAA